MQHEFVSNATQLIDGGGLEDVTVKVDIQHSWVGDLILTLIAPDGIDVQLVNRTGGSQDDFQGTIFSGSASTPIESGTTPFRGSFKPIGDLSTLRGRPAGGSWTLKVEDRASQDGGSLTRWSVGLNLESETVSPFQIDVRFVGGLSVSQQEAFIVAAERWSQIITAESQLSRSKVKLSMIC